MIQRRRHDTEFSHSLHTQDSQDSGLHWIQILRYFFKEYRVFYYLRHLDTSNVGRYFYQLQTQKG